MRHAPRRFAILIAAATIASLANLSLSRSQEAVRPGFITQWTTSERAQVVAVDRTTPAIELLRPDGTRRRVMADKVRNLDQVKPGDAVIATYDEVMSFIVYPPGVQPPPDEDVVAAGRARAGQMPAGFVAEKRVVTRRIVGIDLATSTISLVDPAGGQVLSHRLVDPERQKDLKRVQVGDNVTGTLVQLTAVSIEPPR